MTPLGAALAPLSRGKIAISAPITARNLKLGRWLIYDDPMYRKNLLGQLTHPLTPLGAALVLLSRGKIAISASITAKNLKLGRWLIYDDPM